MTRLSNINAVRGEVDSENNQPFDPLYTEFYLTRSREKPQFADANIDPVMQDCLRFDRPKLDDIFAKSKDMAMKHGDSRVAVLTCGPMSLINDVILKSAQFSGGGVAFDCHHELFEF